MASTTVAVFFPKWHGTTVPIPNPTSNASHAEASELVHNRMRLFSRVRVEDASNRELAASEVSAAWAFLFRAPGDTPWPLVIPVFTSLRITFNGAIEDECGYSDVTLGAQVIPVSRVYIPSKGMFYQNIGPQPAQGGTVFSVVPLAAYGDRSSDEHSWHAPHIYPAKPLLLEYPIFGPVSWQVNISKDDLVFAAFGFQIIQQVSANDVSLISDVEVEAEIAAVTIASA